MRDGIGGRVGKSFTRGLEWSPSRAGCEASKGGEGGKERHAHGGRGDTEGTREGPGGGHASVALCLWVRSARGIVLVPTEQRSASLAAEPESGLEWRLKIRTEIRIRIGIGLGTGTRIRIGIGTGIRIGIRISIKIGIGTKVTIEMGTGAHQYCSAQRGNLFSELSEDEVVSEQLCSDIMSFLMALTKNTPECRQQCVVSFRMGAAA